MLKSYLWGFYLIIICLCTVTVEASFMQVQELIINKKWHEAAQALNKLEDSHLSESDQGLKYFALAVVAGEMQKWSDAELFYNI
ncbi:MAG: hypothetical protein KDD40_12245, partial [Bdellovibrionales bacterium]|nr:hypothetical protein [Bdellovibrionales bacterium]